MKLLTYLSVFTLIVLLFSSNSLLGRAIKVSATPTSNIVARDQQIAVPVTVDISELPEKLGSYTATLTWDAHVLRYVNHRSGSSEGFTSTVVNAEKTSEGKLIFAAAHPYGAEGTINILNVTFEVIGSVGSKSDLNLDFSAMAAAYTFTDLLPYLRTELTGVERGIRVSELPKEFSLVQNHPNPFNPTTKIAYKLPKAEHVNLAIYNVLGQKIRVLVNERKDAGSYDIVWDGKDDLGHEVSAGSYLYKIQAGNFTDMKKMLFVK